MIGNPPYIKEYTNRNAFDGFRETSGYYQGKMDLWYGFACQAIDHLADKGVLCFIATNNWITNAGASKFRNKILNDAKMLILIDFNNYMIFENSASVQTMILLMSKERCQNKYNFNYRKLIKQLPQKTDAIKILSLSQTEKELVLVLNPTIDYKKLQNKTFNFSPLESEVILNKMMCNAKTFHDDEVAQGIVFPQDFLNKKTSEKLSAYPKGTGVFCLTNKELLSLNLSDKEYTLIKPYFTSKQISRYLVDSRNDLWLIYTDSSFNKEDSLNSFPNLKSHLDKFQDVITSSNKPYGLHRARDISFFQGEKIISQRKCPEQVCFSYSDFDTFISQTYFSIKTTRFNMKFLTGLLNSKLIEFWLRNRGKMQGNNFQIDKGPLMNIPIKSNQEAEIKIASLVDEIIVVKKNDYKANVSFQEQQINQIVYKLYGLSDEEIHDGVEKNNPPK